jgi:hypothetical protein
MLCVRISRSGVRGWPGGAGGPRSRRGQCHRGRSVSIRGRAPSRGGECRASPETAGVHAGGRAASGLRAPPDDPGYRAHGRRHPPGGDRRHRVVHAVQPAPEARGPRHRAGAVRAVRGAGAALEVWAEPPPLGTRPRRRWESRGPRRGGPDSRPSKPSGRAIASPASRRSWSWRPRCSGSSGASGGAGPRTIRSAREGFGGSPAERRRAGLDDIVFPGE